MKVANISEVSGDRLKAVEVERETYLLVAHEGEFYALEHRCPHLGLSMKKGKVEGDCLVCPWHGSRFSIPTGENVDWVNSFVGMPLPKWSHKMIALGKQPQPIKSVKLERQGEELHWPKSVGASG